MVLKFLSNSNIVKAPANTGKLIRSSILATAKHQANNGILMGWAWIAVLIKPTVIIKLILPSRLAIPALWRLKIAISTPGVE